MVCFITWLRRGRDFDLVKSGRSAGYRCELVTIEVGSRGFISTNTVMAMSLVPAKKSDIKSLLKQVIRTPLIKTNAV